MASFVPGFPGCAVALLGLVAFAGLTDFALVTEEALVLAALITAAGALGQIAGPALGSRAMGGSAGVATGAAIGAVLGSLIPIPGFAWGGAFIGGAILGFAVTRKGFVEWLRGLVGVAGGCCVSTGADIAAVLAQGAILGIADYLAVV